MFNASFSNISVMSWQFNFIDGTKFVTDKLYHINLFGVYPAILQIN
jgi:hypothetical protein